MRLLYVCADSGIPLCGAKGASAHVRQVTAALAGRGHQVTLACRRIDGENRPPANVSVKTMPADEGEHRTWLDGLVRNCAIEAVIERYSLASGPAHDVAAAHRLPLLLEVNAPLVQEAADFRGLRDVEHWSARERVLLTTADAVVAVSDVVAAHARAAGTAADRVIVVPNGVDLATFAGGDGARARVRHGLADAAAVVGFCGSLKPWHGVDVLIDAMALLEPHAHLLMVGDGPQRATLADRVREQGLTDRVVMTGAVPHHAVPDYLAAMDVAVAPYSPMADFYFSPLKVIEYLAAGCPVVASDQGALRDLASVVALVPPGDAPALADALAALLADPAGRQRLGDRGRALAATRTWDGVAMRLEQLLGATRAAA
jgi:glycosyltransferase involved in cell wall biosynthesis